MEERRPGGLVDVRDGLVLLGFHGEDRDEEEDQQLQGSRNTIRNEIADALEDTTCNEDTVDDGG